MENVITFTPWNTMTDICPAPRRASQEMPGWYKDLPHDVQGTGTEFPIGTVKRCMPMFDAMSAGYLMLSPVAVYVVADEEGGINFHWRTDDFTAVESHSPQQIGDGSGGKDVFKWINTWQVKTPPGYSTMFLPPMGRMLPFQCYPAIVDTDTYENTINFPFVWNEYPYEGVVDQGTPIIQAIPFKREDWAVEYGEGMDHLKEIKKIQSKERYYKENNHRPKRWSKWKTSGQDQSD